MERPQRSADTPPNESYLIVFRMVPRYVDGSIIRVTLKNFVTYEACEFRPGPHLNMIIGPNGTGKSTAVCAMALGLGGNTSGDPNRIMLLGRAKDISEFVKTGKDKASIEIELKRQGRGGNIIIKRQIKKANNTSSWQINGNVSGLTVGVNGASFLTTFPSIYILTAFFSVGQTATHKEVLAKVSALNIQVDNLCQFLPQDKVCEFAQMSPPELLRETQKAAGETELSSWHDQLTEKRSEQKTLQSVRSGLSVKSDKDALAILDSRNANLERDVLRFQEREKILARIKLLEAGIPLARYGQAKREYDDAKISRNAAHSEVRRVERANQPIEQSRGKLKKTVERTGREEKQLLEQFSIKQNQMRKKADSIERLVSSC
ncbi:LOW QUALITY PROTEIN: P-loop containing nucleoside triphosphate hydrolase protein [Jimgerdemannia flammicorona]|uniref:Structural maintenance of chromosomes protein 5 n=1 Tax=Jimgerdemannia flammicorona TaxID=994334 RepID=A0A433QNA1_9FUNG|nr:LOW QUALITY PROTEIN: P-loop containing nucleoside triphosphate hydrolase protein [Jimgerdemannia flammicorona]